MLLTSPDQDIEELIHNTGGDRDRVLRILCTLEKEGFLTITGALIAIRSR